ncbi:MAG: FG-GAP repeat domain-containing protein [Kofleriaceae bacterium]
MSRSLVLLLALAPAGCDRVYNLTRPPADAAPPDGPVDVIDAPPAVCDWATASNVTTILAKGTSIAAGRFNSDAAIDLALGTTGATQLYVFYNSSSGFTAPTTFEIGDFINELAVGSIDGDGLDDLALAGNTTAAAMLSTGTSWDRRPVTLIGGPAGAVAIGDLDGVGLKDLVVTLRNGDVAQVVRGDDTMYVRGQSVITLQDPSGVAIADYDGDTDLDLVVSLAGDNGVSLHPDDGSNFIAGPVLSAGTAPSAVAVARLGTRPVIDIVVANASSDSVIVMRNDGNGVFVPMEDLAVGDEPVALVVADLDANGRADILTANYKSNSVSLLRGTDTGFELARMYPTVDKPNALAVADFDGDTHLDIAVLGEAGFVIHQAVCQ